MPKENTARKQPQKEAFLGLTKLSVPGRHPAKETNGPSCLCRRSSNIRPVADAEALVTHRLKNKTRS